MESKIFGCSLNVRKHSIESCLDNSFCFTLPFRSTIKSKTQTTRQKRTKICSERLAVLTETRPERPKQKEKSQQIDLFLHIAVVKHAFNSTKLREREMVFRA
jgi:hypothetical protein